MKKRIILGAMLISTVVFARGNSMKNNNEQGFNKFANLSEEQQEQLQALRVENFKELQAEKLEIEGLNIEIEKLLAEENVDWKSVNAKVKKAAELEVALELKMLKNREEVKEILGDDAPMLAFGKGKMGMNKGGFQGRSDSKGEGRQEGKRGGMRADKDNDDFRGKANKQGGRDAARGEGFGSERGFNIYSDLTDEQIAKIKEIKTEKATENNKLDLDLASINNETKQLLIADTINWKAVESKINEKVNIKTQLKINNFETREEIEDITGKEIIKSEKRAMSGRSKGMGR